MQANIERLEQQIYMQEEDKRIRALFSQKQSIRSNLELVSRRNRGSRDGQRFSQGPSNVHQENHRSRNQNRNDNRQSRQNLDLQLPVPPPGQQLPRNERNDREMTDEYLETRRDHPQGRTRNPANRESSNRDQSSSPLLDRNGGARESIRFQQQLINESNSRISGSDTGGSISPTYTPPKGIPTSNQPNRKIRKKFSQISYF